jgi:hypothetical protein
VEPPKTADERVADYTEVLAYFTALLALIGAFQAVLIFLQIRLGRQEFIATHRPRIRVRFLQENSTSPDGRHSAFITIANVGDTEAIVTAIGGDMGVRWKADRHWMAPGIRASAAGRKPPPNNVMKGGEHRTYTLSSADPLQYVGVPEIMRNADLMALGEIIYEDRNGVIRRTGFLWYWDNDLSDWLPVQDPQNYED